MEIKTESEIACDWDFKENKQWVSVDSLIDWLNNNSFGYRDNGFNTIDGDELIKKLQETPVVKKTSFSKDKARAFWYDL